MTTSLQEFLRKKTEGTNLLERNRLRSEWLEALNRLIDQIRGWLREADPEEVLEVARYEVERAEQRLGIYNAPALLIRLGTDTVRVVPSGRFAYRTRAIQVRLGAFGASPDGGPLSGGRVDITNEDRMYLLLRDGESDQERWFVLSDRGDELPALDRSHFEAILQDLLS